MDGERCVKLDAGADKAGRLGKDNTEYKAKVSENSRYITSQGRLTTADRLSFFRFVLEGAVWLIGPTAVVRKNQD